MENNQKKLLADRKLYVIFSITLIGVMGVASLTPAFPKIAHELHLSKSEVGWLISAFTLPGIFFTPFAGILADRFGRKAVLVPALFVFAITGSAIFFLHDFQSIILLRIVQGFGAAPLGSLNATLIADFYQGKERPAAMGYNASVLSLSTAIYPLIGGALAAMGWYYPFLLPVLAIPVGLFVIYAMPEPKIERVTNLKMYLIATSQSISRKEVVAVFILSVLTFIILYGAFLTYIPFLVDQKFGLTSPQIGLLFSFSSLTSALAATQMGKLTQKFGSLNLLKIAFLLYTFVNLLIPHTNNLYFFVIPILIFGVAQALNIPSLQTALANLSPPNQRAAFMSINGMVLRLGQTLGPLVIGLGFSVNGLFGVYYLGAAVALVGLVVLFTMVKAEKIAV